jgi:hypothetical protein
MENHYPTMTATQMFEGIGVNARGRFCTTCDLRIENSIHNMENSEVKFPTTDPVMAVLVDYNKR